MPDFEPVFRDGIGYCNVACKFGHIHSHEGQTLVCLHLDNGAICIPWVRSLLPGTVVPVSTEDYEEYLKHRKWVYRKSPRHPIPDEKVSEAVEWLESEVYGVPGLTEVWSEKIRTVIDAYRARNPKGTPMSTDNVIYVQRRGAPGVSLSWCVWLDSVSNESPQPNNTIRAKSQTRSTALQQAHDFAAQIQPSHGVQEQPPEPPDKTQGQQDAERLLRELVDLPCIRPSEETWLKDILARLEST